MTTNDTAAKRTKRVRTAGMLAATIAAMGLAGCETSSNLLGSNNSPPPSASLTPPPTAAQPAPQSAVRVAIAPVIGPPEQVSKALASQVADAAQRQKVAIAQGPDGAAYTLRGYFVAPSKDKAGNKLSYIWDVTDSSGKRVNRITGEETLAAAGGADPWAAVSPAIIQAISDKTASSLATWLPTQQPGATPIASAPAQPQPMAQAQLTPASTTTGSIPGAILTVAPRVTGAPGDGNSSLAAAMRRELEEKGMQMTESGPGAYRVSADVKIKPPKDGSQAISINWVINDPKGVEVAKITQNNDVPAGYLDKAWGQSAEDAAKAASIQIKQVIADHQSGRQIQSSAGQGSSKVN